MIKSVAILGLVLSATACSHNQAGEPLDSSLMGAATANNAAVMRGEGEYAIQLAARFAEEVPTTINFAFNDARLDGEARAVLDRQAAWIKQFQATLEALPEVVGAYRMTGDLDYVLRVRVADVPAYDAFYIALAEAAAYFAFDVLETGGTFVAKVLAGGAEGELQKLLKQKFTKVVNVKPPSSRSDSSEKFVIATGFRG